MWPSLAYLLMWYKSSSGEQINKNALVYLQIIPSYCRQSEKCSKCKKSLIPEVSKISKHNLKRTEKSLQYDISLIGYFIKSKINSTICLIVEFWIWQKFNFALFRWFSACPSALNQGIYEIPSWKLLGFSHRILILGFYCN